MRLLRLLSERPLAPGEILSALRLGRRSLGPLRTLLGDLLEEGRVQKRGRRYEVRRLEVEGGPRVDRVGIFERRGRAGVVTPYRDDTAWRVPVAQADCGDARDGDVVVLDLGESAARPTRGRRDRRRTPSRGRARGARVVEVLGPPGTPDADFRAVVWRRRLRMRFPKSVQAEAEAVESALDPAEVARRVDLRDRAFVTIDPATARDHDDAVLVEPRDGGGARLWVAIADVSHYVTEGSRLDREALARGNSVYFPDRAIPMLPERLSGDVCSLRPEEDRLAMVVELVLDRDAHIARRNFYPAVIRSRARLVYEDAARVMEGGAAGEVAASLVPDLRAFGELALRLQRRRAAGGSLDFDLPSAEIVLGDDKRPVDIVEAPRTIAHRAVEEAMLAANRSVAQALFAAKAPSIYRNHEPPSFEDLDSLRELLGDFGLLEHADRELDAPALARVLVNIAGHPEERAIHRAVLRSMRLARYGSTCLGHFALAFERYTHFTSPIRRYADLAVHRALKGLLGGEPPRTSAAERTARFERSTELMAAICGRISWLERVATEAEREMVDLAKCAFLAGRIGDHFEGTVSGVARHGVYVTLDDFFVDGLVPIASLPGTLELDERETALVARRSRERFGLGDRLRVRVEAVNPVRTHINFGLVSRLPRD